MTHFSAQHDNTSNDISVVSQAASTGSDQTASMLIPEQQIVSFDCARIDAQLRQQAIAKSRERGARLRELSHYPQPPAIILRAWNELGSAIFELMHHMEKSSSVAQVIRAAQHPMGPSTKAKNAFPSGMGVLKNWANDLLVLVGTLPIETGELGDKTRLAALSRIKTGGKGPRDGALSAQARGEGHLCIETMCAKLWYAKHIDRRDDFELQSLLYRTLQFFYWECGVPEGGISMLFDDPIEPYDPIFDSMRQVNYRQLYAIHEDGQIETLFTNIRAGVLALIRYRNAYANRFAQRHTNDVRWHQSFEEHIEAIQLKYQRVGPDDELDDIDAEPEDKSLAEDAHGTED